MISCLVDCFRSRQTQTGNAGKTQPSLRTLCSEGLSRLGSFFGKYYLAISFTFMVASMMVCPVFGAGVSLIMLISGCAVPISTSIAIYIGLTVSGLGVLLVGCCSNQPAAKVWPFSELC